MENCISKNMEGCRDDNIKATETLHNSLYMIFFVAFALILNDKNIVNENDVGMGLFVCRGGVISVVFACPAFTAHYIPSLHLVSVIFVCLSCVQCNRQSWHSPMYTGVSPHVLKALVSKYGAEPGAFPFARS